jgi:predicted Na+-dependent transporter
MNFNIFTYTLPFVAFILDHSTKRLINKPEKAIYIIVKLVLIIYYLGAYVLALQQVTSDSHFLICLINFIIFPLLTLAYGYLLRKGKLG